MTFLLQSYHNIFLIIKIFTKNVFQENIFLKRYVDFLEYFSNLILFIPNLFDIFDIIPSLKNVRNFLSICF